MKGIRISIALFAILMLTIPMICIPMHLDVQQTAANNSNSRPVSSNYEAAPATAQTFKLYRTATGSVESISPHDYICGVLAAEMSAQAPAEALKAQAVAAFTYACYKREGNLSNPQAAAVISGADFSDDASRFEAYISKTDARTKWGTNFDSLWNKIDQAVSSVEGKVVTYKGKTIAAVFYAISSGKTESSKDVWGSSLPYLQSVDSSWDKNAPSFETTVTMTADDFKSKVNAAKLDGILFDKDPAKWVKDIVRSKAGGVVSGSVCGAALSGSRMRSLFKLRSANFELTYQTRSKTFVFDVRGYGHGVGLSQYGAKYLAQQGKNYEQILKYYYTGVDITDYVWPQ